MTTQGTGPRFYRVRLVQQRTKDGEMWTAEHPTLLGCHVVRKGAQQAIDALMEVREEWLSRARAAGKEVPPPEECLNYELVLAPDHTAAEAAAAREAVSPTADQVRTQRTPTLTFA